MIIRNTCEPCGFESYDPDEINEHYWDQHIKQTEEEADSCVHDWVYLETETVGWFECKKCGGLREEVEQ